MAQITLPGLIDCHVHFREPGLEHKGTLATEAAAARAGGVTAVCEMPNTAPPTVTIAALEDKVRRASRIKDCDIRFFMGATEPRHLLAIRDLWRSAAPHMRQLKSRCAGLKLYFDHSTGDQGAGKETIEEAFKLSAELGFTIVAHCEDAKINSECRMQNSELDVSLHSEIRPARSEIIAIEHAIGLVRAYGGKLHIAHLSTAGGIDAVRKAKKEGLAVTCEVAPQHLFLTVDDYALLGTFAKMNPPLRTREHQEALWKGIADGTVDCIATDHAPHTLGEKKIDPPLSAPSGVPGVETMLPLLLTVVAGKWPGKELKASSYKLEAADIVRLCFDNPNRIFSLGKSPEDATVTIDPDAEWTIRGEELHSKCGWTPYEGWQVKGRVVNVS